MSAMFTAAASEYIVGDEKVTWLEAETWCLEQGYHLASIHSAEDNAEILALCTEPKCWTGLHCIDSDNFEWRWSDGTDYDYQDNWYPGEPNNKENPTNEDCVEMYDNGMWNNHECQVLNYPICRVENGGHYIARGDPLNSKFDGDVVFYCADNDDSVALYGSRFDSGIAVRCCSADGQTGYSPDCNAHPATYQDAVDVCTSRGYRLCTVQEIILERTKGTGCSYDGAYTWVSDECREPVTANAAIAVSGGAAVVAEDADGADDDGNTALNYMETVYGVAIAVVVLSAVVLLAVFMAKRKKSAGKKTETEMCDAVHVPELSPTDCVGMDTMEVATGKESGDGVEAARE